MKFPEQVQTLGAKELATGAFPAARRPQTT